MPDRPDDSEVRYIAAALRRLDKIGRLIWQYFASTHQTAENQEELFDHLNGRIDELARLLTLILAALEKQRPGSTGPLSNDAFERRRRDLREILKREHATLGELQKTRASQGAWPPPETINAIETVEERITELRAELDYYDSL